MIAVMARHGDGDSGQSDGGTNRYLLWGLANPRLDLALSLSTLVLLAASRFALLASGPWEWDETIFARGMLHFELAAHFPQPPGFPGLLALGHLLLPLAGTPYRALQLISAFASVLALWPLAMLGRKVASPAVATSAALLVLFLPGPWLYSVRGFSSTAAVVLALWAAALLVGGLDGRRATAFTLVLTAAFLVRPILLPTVALVWLIGVESIRPRRRMLPGVVLGLAAIVVAVLVMVRLEGGFAAFVEPFVRHGDFHVARLHRNTRILAEIGLIKGVGGLASAAVLTGLSMIGLAVWWRRVGAKVALAWIVILGLTATQLIMLQNRSYARYAVGVQMATAPLLAAAGTLVAAPVAVIGFLGTTAYAAWSSLPLLREQHSETFGAWEATLDASRRAADRGWAVVVEPEVHVFSSYQWTVLEAAGEPTPPMVLSPRAPEAWTGVDRPWLVATVHPHLYWPSLTRSQTVYEGVSEQLRPLTQDRFLSAALIDNPPLPVGRWWALEHRDDGRPFMWAGSQAELWLPPVPEGSLIGLELRPAPGESPLTVKIGQNGGVFDIDGRAEATRIWIRTGEAAITEPLIVGLDRAEGYPPGEEDDRPLSVQLLDVVVRPPGSAWGGSAATESERGGLRLELEGGYGGERFGELGRGVWLGPAARFRIAVDDEGRLTLRLAAPRPTPANPRVVVGGEVITGPLAMDQREAVAEIRVDEVAVGAGFIEFDLISDAYRPASDGGADTRELGVVLLGVEFEPDYPSEGWWNEPLRE
jgi:hypothetical protein